MPLGVEGNGEGGPEAEGFFPPSPPEGFGREDPALGEPGLAIMVDALRDSQFWKDCPVELGSVLELPMLRRNGEEEQKGLVCVYVADVYRACIWGSRCLGPMPNGAVWRG